MHPDEREKFSLTPLSDDLERQMACGLANAGFAGLTPEMIQGAAAFYGVGADEQPTHHTRDLTIIQEFGSLVVSAVSGYDIEDLVRNAVRRATMRDKTVEKMIIHSKRESFNILGY